MRAPVRRAIGRYTSWELADIPQPLGGVVRPNCWTAAALIRSPSTSTTFLPSATRSSLRTASSTSSAQCQRRWLCLPSGRAGRPSEIRERSTGTCGTCGDLRDRQDFACDVYGRFGLRFNAELRRQAVGTLPQRRFDFRGGFDPVPRATFLKEMARSRGCIDLPGQADAISLRLISCLAIGACIVGPRPKNELPAPLIDRVHVAWTRDDQSDLVDLCEYYIENSGARRAEWRQRPDDSWQSTCTLTA